MAEQGPLNVKRHYSHLTEEETDAVVAVLANLIVTYLKSQGEHSHRGSGAAPTRDSEGRT